MHACPISWLLQSAGPLLCSEAYTQAEMGGRNEDSGARACVGLGGTKQDHVSSRTRLPLSDPQRSLWVLGMVARRASWRFAKCGSPGNNCSYAPISVLERFWHHKRFPQVRVIWTKRTACPHPPRKAATVMSWLKLQKSCGPSLSSFLSVFLSDLSKMTYRCWDWSSPWRD